MILTVCIITVTFVVGVIFGYASFEKSVWEDFMDELKNQHLKKGEKK